MANYRFVEPLNHCRYGRNYIACSKTRAISHVGSKTCMTKNVALGDHIGGGICGNILDPYIRSALVRPSKMISTVLNKK